MKIRVLIVDDEPLARERLRRLLAGQEDLEIIGECGSGVEAVEQIPALKPTLVFLDVQMPELDGFGVIAALRPEDLPAVVFTTAFDKFAVQAFEVHAVDYLLKPFDRERLEAAVAKARRTLSQAPAAPRTPQAQQQLTELLNEVRPKLGPNDRISVKSAGRIVLIRPEEIDWIEAADNYVSLHVGKITHMLRETMNAMESRLDATRFLRISRSIIVNKDRVKELHPLFHGDFALVLTDGTKLNSSRNYRDRLRDNFGV
jgi:two-component system LytT family response regulator